MNSIFSKEQIGMRCLGLCLFFHAAVAAPECRTSTAKYVTCQGAFEPPETLKEKVQEISLIDINAIELRNATLHSLPDDIFQGTTTENIRKIVISHSALELLSGPDHSFAPFKSVTNSVEQFEIYDTNFVYAWNFSALSTLSKLRTLIVEDSEFISVPDIFRMWQNLAFLQLINCSIKDMHRHAFKNNLKLAIMSLSNNLIDDVPRSLFPNPAQFLWSLDLSFNKIKYLSKEMFTGMPKLKSLKLDNNRLTRIDSKKLDSVFSDLTELWLDGNSAICWSLCWVAKYEVRPLFLDSSRCKMDARLKSGARNLFAVYPHCKQSAESSYEDSRMI